MKKKVLVFFDQVRHNPGCKATEDDKRLAISDLESTVIVLSMHIFFSPEMKSGRVQC